MNYILIVANPCDANEIAVNPISECRRRLASKRWVFFKNTAHRTRISANDRLLFYCSDRRVGGQVIAKAKVVAIRPPLKEEMGLIGSGTADTVVDFDCIDEYTDPISFRSILPSLSFAPQNMKKWGNVVFGGCRSISDADFRTIDTAPKSFRITSLLNKSQGTPI